MRTWSPDFMPILSRLCNLSVATPLFFGALFTPFPESRLFWQIYLTRYVYLLLPLLTGGGFALFVTRVYLGAGRGGRLADSLRIAGLLVLAAVVMAGLELARNQFAGAPFAVLVGVLGLYGLTFSLRTTGRVRRSVLAEAGAVFCLSYLSFYLVLSSWQWQPALLCLGLTCVLIGRRIAILLSQDRLPRRRWSASVGLLMAAAPALTCVLSVFSQAIEPGYALLCAIFPLIVSLANEAKELPPGEKLGPRFASRANAAAGAFIVILVGLRIWVGQSM